MKNIKKQNKKQKHKSNFAASDLFVGESATQNYCQHYHEIQSNKKVGKLVYNYSIFQITKMNYFSITNLV